MEVSTNYWILICILGFICGFAVNIILENKGYSESWSWRFCRFLDGFFFGIPAVIGAVLTKPKADPDSSFYVGKDYVFTGFGNEEKTTDVPNSWRCTHCGKVNTGDVETCECGWNKFEIMPTTESKKAMFCYKCGTQSTEGAVFCRNCGEKLIYENTES